MDKNLSKHNPSFKNRFMNITGELESNVLLSRAIVDVFGCDIPWIVMANNNQERKEKTRRCAVNFSIAFLSPFITLPLTNRIGMKWAGLTNKFWDNNHKAIHISNKHLKNASDTEKGLTELAQKTTQGPIEHAYRKIFNKPCDNRLNLKALRKNAGGSYEALRKKLIKTKNGVLAFDLLFTIATMGSVIFLNNYFTKKSTGQSGFSAEMSMADKGIVEKRAEKYEKNKKKRYFQFLGIATAVSAALPLAVEASLLAKKPGKLLEPIKKNSNFFDYRKGIYMSRLPLFITCITYQTSTLLASRNKTEFKDNLTRMSVADGIYFGGDMLLLSLFARMSDKFAKTNLLRTNQKDNKREIVKLAELNKLADSKLNTKNKRALAGIFWANMVILSAALGWAVPFFINKMIRSDVKKDVDKQKSQGSPAVISHENKFELVKSQVFKDFIVK